MPYTEFARLPDNSKAWIFASNRPLTADERKIVDTEVPNFLSQWTAHGAPVPASHEIRDDQFLVIAADESVAPGGCSIDGLFRFIRALGEHLQIDMLSSGRIWYRDKAGEIRGTERSEFRKAAQSNEISDNSPVFDTSLDHLATYRQAFEQPARNSWAASMFRQER